MKNWTQQIDQTTDDFHATFGSLSSEQMNWKPSPDTWSIAQNIDHLMVINKTYFPVFESLTAGNYKPPFMANLGFMVSFFGKTILKSAQPDRSRKMKTFSIWEPSSSEIPEGVLERFSQHQEELKHHITELEGIAAQGSVISSPANRNIAYKLETAFDIIVSHEQRHFEQAKEVLSAMKEK